MFTERDRATVAELGASTPITLIPLGYPVPDSPLDPIGTEKYGVVCVGSFIHPPNVDGAAWLAPDILPSVRARVPAASLRLVGSHLTGAVQALENEHVTFTVDAPDVRPYLDAAAVVAVPIRLGGGMRVKALGALGFGKAIVATPLALEGLDVRNGEHVLVARTAAEFADALVELLLDVGRRRTIAEAARRWADENLGLDTQARAYENLYAGLVGSRVTRGAAPNGLDLLEQLRRAPAQ